jgi:hypothetical protein
VQFRTIRGTKQNSVHDSPDLIMLAGIVAAIMSSGLVTGAILEDRPLFKWLVTAWDTLYRFG